MNDRRNHLNSFLSNMYIGPAWYATEQNLDYEPVLEIIKEDLTTAGSTNILF